MPPPQIKLYKTTYPSVDSADAPMIDPAVSRYELREKLGEGGMGVVYLGRERSLGRLVALKFLSPDLSGSPDEAYRFEQEALAISALNHPNIATIYGFEDSGDQKYLVLEYLPGGTLASRIARLNGAGSALSIADALDYAIQIVDGLRHAHNRGIVHRDIKSSNILFTADGRPKITDFGLARLAEPRYVTVRGTLLGTPPAMSPEQARGEEVDGRSDLFSFGILLYEMLTGESPFRGSSPAAVIHEILYRTPLSMHEHVDGIPDVLQQIVSKTLAKDRAERYQSAGELLEDLRVVRAGLVLSEDSCRNSADTLTLPSFVRPRRTGWILGGALSLLAILLAIVALKIDIAQVRTRVTEWLNIRSLPSEKRIAVLPFSTEGTNAADQAFTDGLNDVISFKLSQLEQFHGSLLVISGSDVNARGVKTADLARQIFGANLAVTGKVARRGDQVFAMVSLIDTKTLAYVKTATIDARSADITTFRDRVVSRVTQMLELELTAQAQRTLQQGDTAIATAYTYYVEGRGYLARYDNADNLDRSVDAFRRALMKDPSYALAYAGIAEAQLRKFKVSKDPDILADAFKNCSQALELNDSLAPVHTSMGLIEVARGEYAEAESEFRRAITLNPVSAEAYRGLAYTFEARNRLKDAERVLRQAVDLRKADWAGYNDLATFYFNHARYRDAVPWFQRARDITPDNYLVNCNLGALSTKIGRYDDAIGYFQKSLQLRPSALTYSNLGMAYYLMGRYEEAATQLEKAVQLTPTRESYWGNLGHAYRWTPSLAKAPEAYRKAIQLGLKEESINPKDAALRARIATYWASLGNKKESIAEMKAALKISPHSEYVLYRAALVYEQAGDRKRALDAVKAAIENGYSLEEIRNAPPLKGLREDRRYRRLMDRRASLSQDRE